MNRKTFYLASTATLASVMIMSLGMVACDEVKAPHGPGVDLLPASQYPKIAAEGKPLSRALRFGAPVVTPSTPSKPMQVTVPIRSLDDEKALNVQYRFEFFDAAGRPLGDDGGRGNWRYVRLDPRIQVFLSDAALDTAAVDWRLTLQPAR